MDVANHVQYRNSLEYLEDDALDKLLIEVTLLLEEVYHVTSIGLMLHQYHRIDSLEYFNEWRDVEGFKMMEVAYFILHQFDSSSLFFDLRLVVDLQCYHSVIEDVLALTDNAKVAVAQNILHAVVLFEVGENAQRRDHRIEVYEELLVGCVQHCG